MVFKLNKTLIKGSIVLLISFGIFNFFNFLFHFSMVRMLTVEDYGILASLFSIIYVLGVFSESIQLVITKYTSSEKNKGKIKNILRRSLKKSSWVSSLVFAVYVIISVPLSSFLKISYPLMVLNGIIIFTAFLSPVTRGIMQGEKKFGALGFNMILESVVKLGLAILFVFIGWRVSGAITGALIGTFFAFLFSFASVRDVMKSKENRANTRGIYGYTGPAFIIMMVIIAFYSLDVVLAKIFFSADIAGSYAIASTLSKTIVFATHPIGRALFPLSAENKKDDKRSNNLLLNAVGIVLIVVVSVLLLFYFFPSIIILFFSGEIVVGAVSVLFLLGVAISLVSFTNIVLLYKLSLGKVKGYKYLVFFLLVEILLLWRFSENLIQFSIAFITASAIFLWGSLFLLRD
jgi:stage V sporulation protein B